MLKKICCDIYLVQGENNGLFPFSNSILIRTQSGKDVLIDTGCGIDTLQKLKEEFNIAIIINSHSHADHCAGNWIFEGQVEKIFVSKEGEKSAGNLKALSVRFTEPGPLPELWKDIVTKYMDFKEFRPTHTFNEQTLFEFGNVKLIPIHTPGHIKDHYCFYEPTQKVMFAFDIDLTSFGPWYGHLESSLSEFKNSIQRIKSFEMDAFVSGHKGIIRDNICERLDAYNAKFDLRDRKIQSLLKRTSNIDDLTDAAPIYGEVASTEPLLKFWEKQMILKHISSSE